MNEKNIFYPRFRTFSKHYNKYFKVGAIDFVKKSIKLELFGVNNSEWLPLEDFKLEQFTGLQDKEGKDIYEGDIVMCTVSQEIFEIIWDYQDAVFAITNNDTHVSFSDALISKTVIVGNINKNKEYYK